MHRGLRNLTYCQFFTRTKRNAEGQSSVVVLDFFFAYVRERRGIKDAPMTRNVFEVSRKTDTRKVFSGSLPHVI